MPKHAQSSQILPRQVQIHDGIQYNIKTLTKLTWEVANDKEDLDMDHWSHKRAEQ